LKKWLLSKLDLEEMLERITDPLDPRLVLVRAFESWAYDELSLVLKKNKAIKYEYIAYYDGHWEAVYIGPLLFSWRTMLLTSEEGEMLERYYSSRDTSGTP
jgi:hypothetical protein